MADEGIGVVGLGTMGAGIAQLALEHGHEVVVYDVDEAAQVRGRDRIREGLSRRAARLGLDADSLDDWVEGRLAGLRQAETIGLLAEQSDVVVEAALEDLGLKREIFRALDAAAPHQAILATNTSALRVTDIAQVVARPERVVGLHFFNPVAVLPLLEVVRAEQTDDATLSTAFAIGTSLKRSCGRCRPSRHPGLVDAPPGAHCWGGDHEPGVTARWRFSGTWR